MRPNDQIAALIDEYQHSMKRKIGLFALIPINFRIAGQHPNSLWPIRLQNQPSRPVVIR